MDNVKAFILSQLVEKNISKDQAKELLMELSRARSHVDIAVIGLAGRFASADDEDQFWTSLTGGENCLRDFPEIRKQDMADILRNPYYSELLLGRPVDEADLNRIYDMSGYMSRIDEFDAEFFAIPPLEADYMDPHQRIALEVAHHALENAGYGGDSVKGSRTGVFLGRDQTNYSYYKMFSERNPMQLSGSWEGLVASRISYLYDFKGPSIMTDTACSAGAVCIHQAIQSLVLGECDMALAGGINLSSGGEVKPEFMSGATMDNVTSGAAVVRTFDAAADGTLWGEGAGILVLKPLSRALADGDHVRAVIKATAINNDGTSNSITAPNALLQEEVIVDAWTRADISPESITYVEAHGTGTVLGDPIEAKGLTNAFRRYTQRRQFCGIGSLKTSMGHMVAASGVAAVTKVVKALEHKMLPPSANFSSPNPYIDFLDSPLFVNDRLTAWEPKAGEPRRAGVSSFGFIRTNCHLVLEEAPGHESPAQQSEHYCFTLSARNAETLQTMVDQYRHALSGAAWTLPDICWTTNLGRGHLEHRIMIVAASIPQLMASLDALHDHGLHSQPDRGIFVGHHHEVSGRKTDLDDGDITAAQRTELSGRANDRLLSYRDVADPAALHEAAALYVRGANPDFARYYGDEARRRVPLPGYPFARTRHWAPVLRSRVTASNLQPTHPLLGQQISADDTDTVFERVFSVDQQWVLSDHRINERPVVPGTTYLEMARAAHAAVSGASAHRMSNVFFLQPLAVDEGDTATVRTTLSRDGSGYTFRITADHDGTWLPLVEGRITSADGVAAEGSLDLDAEKARATAVFDPYESGVDSTEVFQFGPRWDCVRAVWQHDAGATARIGLPAGVDDETATYLLHPAKLDQSVNLISQIHDDTFLPYMYKDVVLHGPMPAEFHTTISVTRDDSQDGETITYDVDLFGADGKPFARVRDYTVKKVDWSRFSMDAPPTCLTMEWVAAEDVAQDSEALAGTWAVMTADDFGHDVAQRLAAAVTTTEFDVTTGDLAEVVTGAGEADGLVLVIPTRCDEPGAAARLLAGVFHEITSQRLRFSQGLTVVTQGAWPDHGIPADPEAAAATALAVVIGQENPQLSVDVVDVAAHVSDDLLVTEVIGTHRTLPRVLTADGALVRQAVQVLDPLADSEPTIDDVAGSTWLITGGTGGLGMAFAEQLADAGAARIIVTGRRTPEGELAERIANLAGVEFMTCDVSDPQSVAELAERLRSEGVHLNGLLHAAGIAGAGVMATKDAATFDAVLAPKVMGGVAMVELAAQHDGCRVALFSSVTSALGGPGQGDYCCANAYLDGLAARSRERGLAVASIQWPAFSDVGMAVDHGMADLAPVRAITVATALPHLAQALRSPAEVVIPSTINIATVAEEADGLPFLLPPEILGALAASDGAESGEQVQLAGLSDPTPTQLTVGSCYAGVLGLTRLDAFASFQDLGGNSLMTTQLLGRLESHFPGVVDIADLFSYASVADLAQFIDEQTGSAVDVDLDDELAEVLGEIGDDDLQSMFAGGTE